jgi:hypothetical protein
MFKIWCKAHLKLNNFWNEQLFFSDGIFFIICAQNEKDVIKRAKGIEIIEIHFYSIVQCIWFNHVFGLEHYEFWECGFKNLFISMW